nr:MAG TPA: hypothetical protein [Caudoviricetes sp.]
MQSCLVQLCNLQQSRDQSKHLILFVFSDKWHCR